MAPVRNKKQTNKKQILIKRKNDSENEQKPEEKVVSSQLQKKIDKARKKQRPKLRRGVVLLRHLPKGFLEDQIKSYFEQFGAVTRVRLARSRKTGGSKSFAFVEFRVPEVAQIAAETMNNYLMFQKLVKAYYIPPEEQKFNYFRTKVRPVVNNHGKTIFTSGKMISKSKKVKKYNTWTDKTYSERVSNNLRKLQKLKKKFADTDLDFDSIIIKPKLAVPISDIDEVNTTNTSQENENEQPGSLLLVKKRKLSDESVGGKKNKKVKGKLSLKNLLEKTLNDSESSADEDYLPIEDYNPNETLEIPPDAGDKLTLAKKLSETLIEETKSDSEADESFKPSNDEESEDDSDAEDSQYSTQDTDDNDSNFESDKEDLNNNNKQKKSKFDKANRLENLIRRKPHSGGITKKNIKSKNDKSSIKTKSTTKLGQMKAIAANEILKNKNSKPIKSTDLKMKRTN